MYLSLDGIERESFDFYKTSAGLPMALYDYAQKYWADHVVGEPEEKLKNVALQLLQTRAGMSLRWWDFVNIYPIHEVAYRNLFTLCKELLNRGQHEINARTVGGLECTALNLACLFGHDRLAELLLENGADINLADSRGYTALHHAVVKGHLNVVQLLLKRESRLETRSHRRVSALSLAICNNHLDIARALVHAGADVNFINHRGKTPLHLAVSGNHANLTIDLLQHGADVNAPNSKGRAPLYLAIEGEKIELVKVLLKNGADVTATTNDGETPLHSAAKVGSTELVIQLKQSADINVMNVHGLSALDHNTLEDGNNSDQSTKQTILADSEANIELYVACQTMSVRLATKAIDRGSDLDSYSSIDHKTGLHHAAEIGNLPTVNLLLSCGARFYISDSHGKTALLYAIDNNHFDVVERLLRVGASPALSEDHCRVAMHYAIKENCVEITEALVDLLDLESIVALPDDEGGRNLLHHAAFANWESIVERLLRKGMNANCADVIGCTPLHYAAAQGSTSLIQSLLSAGASVDSRISGMFLNRFDNDGIYSEGADCISIDPKGDPHGLTPLHLAIALYDEAEDLDQSIFGIPLLIDGGCDINARTSLGRTPLIFAAALGSLYPVIHLLVAGADFDQSDDAGITPLIAATANGHNTILELLHNRHVNADAYDTQKRKIALHYAVEEGLDYAIQLLIPSSNLFHFDFKGRSPYDVARKVGNAGIAATLKLAMDNVRQKQRSYSFPLPDKISSFSQKYDFSSSRPSQPSRRHSVVSGSSLTKSSQRDLRPFYIEAKRKKAELAKLEQEMRKVAGSEPISPPD